MIAVQLLLVFAAVLAALAVRPILAGQPVRSEFLELRRLWRKDAAGTVAGVSGVAAPLALACDIAVAALVPTASLDVPFADLLAVFGLLAAGRLVSALAAVEWGSAPGGTVASRTALFLAAAGPASVLVALVVSGLGGGSSGLPPSLAAVRDGVALPAQLPLLLAAAAVAVLGHADMACGGPDGFSGGRTLFLLRLSSVVRWTAWLDLVAVLLPPVTPAAFWPGLGVWVLKLAVLAVLSAWLERRYPFRPVAAPALAGLLGFLGTLLLALRGGAA